MTFSIDQLKEQIPLYVNRMLSKTERKAFEERIQHFPILKNDLAAFSEIKSIYNEMKAELQLPPDYFFDRIKHQIKTDEMVADNKT